MKGILVVADFIGGASSKATLEAAGLAQTLAKKFAEPLLVATVGEEHPEARLRALEKVVKSACPRFVIFFSNYDGKEFAPRLAYRMNASLVTNVIGVRGAESSAPLCFLQSAYGGKAIASHTVKNFPVVLTVKPHTFPQASECSAVVREIAADCVSDADVARLRLIRKTSEEVSGVKLEDAAIVVSGGRGMNGPEGFQKLAELAAVLGGAVGASRAATDAGWCSHALQVGQTGKTVSPDLYFAFGISGATQHVAGMSGAKTIVAINRDADAPIFKVAHFGIVADAHAILPLLITKCKALRSE